MKQDIDIKAQVRQILLWVKQVSPGRAVELRIPPYGAIQCVAGSNHRRGMPANQVEMDGETLIKLIKSPTLWEDLCRSGLIRASGSNSDLSDLFAKVSKLNQTDSRGL
jgi:hypothetical protein